MNNHDELERMLREQLRPAPLSGAADSRMRGIWNRPAADSAPEAKRALFQLHLWQWAFAAVAAFAVVLAVLHLYPGRQPDAAGTAPVLVAGGQDTQPPALPAAAPAETSRTLISAEDLGLVNNGNEAVRRQVRVRYMENERWQDRRGGGWIQRSQPREAIFQLPAGAAGVTADGTVIERGPDYILPAPPDNP